MFSIYLERYAYPEDLILDSPSKDLGITVVIPSYGEPHLRTTLQSLEHCQLPENDVEVIVIVNDSNQSPPGVLQLNQHALDTAPDWKTNEEERRIFHILYQKLPVKHAGVGFARKIGMDQAVRRFQAIGKDGIIACLDADCTVEPNYLTSLEQHFKENRSSPGCSIYYEHPLQGSLDPEIYQGIAAYELHLRYYTHALKYSGHSYAFQTVGSSMAVRCSAYQKQGGMNRRKAGEDFYFLQKIFTLGNFTELKTTRVIPSSRTSSRVPFGTGKAIHKWLRQKNKIFFTYNYMTFSYLKNFINLLLEDDQQSAPRQLWQLCPASITGFLKYPEFENKVIELREHTTDQASYQKRFFIWCNGFFVFKFANYCRDHHEPDLPVQQAASWLLEHHYQIKGSTNCLSLLHIYRALDRN